MPRAPDDEGHRVSGISAIRKYAFMNGNSRLARRQQLEGAVTVMHISGMNDTLNRRTIVSTRICRLPPLIYRVEERRGFSGPVSPPRIRTMPTIAKFTAS
jgi:hypothetical protein